MMKIMNQLYTEMINTLDDIAVSSVDQLKKAELSYQAVRSSLEKVKEYIVAYEFPDKAEEIHFFKEVKPKFLRELIYHMEVFYIEARNPKGNSDLQKQYFKQISERIHIFFERNHVLYIYYRMGKTDFDDVFFTRGTGKDFLQPEYTLDMDPRFSTIQSYKLAKIQAYEMLNDHVQQVLYTIDNPHVPEIQTGKRRARTFWTDTKAALIELAYALHSRGSVDHGKGDVKQIITDLEQLFNVQVGNFYRTFQSMRIRKKNRTVYLDVLKESLERRMDDTDLNFS